MEKSSLQLELDKQFEGFLNEINGKFASAGEQMKGMVKWVQVQLQILTDRLRKSEISQNIIDVNLTATLELLLEKGLVTEDEYKNKIQVVINRKSADAPKSK
jgi:hypothetical protein